MKLIGGIESGEESNPLLRWFYPECKELDSLTWSNLVKLQMSGIEFMYNPNPFLNDPGISLQDLTPSVLIG
jgi:hypothetical protein